MAPPLSLWHTADPASRFRSVDAVLSSLEQVSKIIATLALPVVLLVIGNWYSSSQKDKDLGQKYVELAIGILSEEPTEDNAKLRGWAVDIVNRYAEVKFESDLAVQLITRETLPSVVSTPLSSGFQAVEGERAVARIIVSDTQTENVEQTVAGLRHAGVSYHYLVGPDGSVQALVKENDIAFHTRGANTDSIGIGLVHLTGTAYPEPQVRALAELVGELRKRHGLDASAILPKSDFDPRKPSDFATIADVVRGAVGGEAPFQ